MENESSAPQSNFVTKLVFVFFGVASLLGWNALLTELDFFNYFLEGMNPYVSFSFLNYILNILFQFLLVWKKDLFTLKFQLIVGIVGSIAFLILIPFFTLILTKDSTINHLVTGGLVFLMGFINGICSAGFFNLVSHFPLEMIVSLSTGQGFSGIAMNILQYIVLVSIPLGDDDDDIEDNKKRVYTIRGWIFFGISSLILVISLILLMIYYNTDYFQYYIKKSSMSNKKDDPNSGLLAGEGSPEEEKNTLVSLKQDIKPSPLREFLTLFRKIWDLDLLIMFIYIVTFLLFPNASIKHRILKMDSDYSSNTVITIYNVFDTIGRYLVAKVTPTKKLNMSIILSRSVIIITLILTDYFGVYVDNGDIILNKATSILLIINVAALAATNGITTTLSFGLAPNEVEDQYKGQAGTSLSFFLIVGIFLGACLAFGTNKIMASYEPSIQEDTNITNITSIYYY